MAKTELYNKTNPHYPLGMKVEVNDKRLQEHLDKGFALSSEKSSDKLIEKKEKVESVIKENLPNKDWTEKEIKGWLLKNNIPIKYSITNDEKADKLQELKDKGYL